MCDFPNVENNDLELEALSSLCEEWDRRINFLPELFRQGRTDESLILCCCYIEAIGKWFGKSEMSSKEAFTKALLRYGENEVFSRLYPRRLLSLLQQDEDVEVADIILLKLRAVFDSLQDEFYPLEEIRTVCRAALSDEEFDSLHVVLWRATLACLAYKVTRCEGVHHGMVTVWRCGDAILDFKLFHPALKRIFEKARGLIMSGRLRIY
ncbi:MAG: hypothetical protein AB9866_20435 [Syntrophobacteraceae bacterium]